MEETKKAWRIATLLGTAATALMIPAAHAQSSVTLYGILDVGVTYASNENGHAAFLAQDSAYTPSLWGLHGIEDLGGGYKAVFDLQSQFFVDTGAGIPGPNADFNRGAYLGIEKDGIGKITFGQQYNLLFDFLFFPPARLDGAFLYGGLFNMRQGPFSALAIPGNMTGSLDFDETAGMTRVSNSVKVTSAVFDGFRFGALYGFGNTAGSLSANNTVGFGMNYVFGTFGAGAAYNETRYASMNDGHDGIRNIGVGVGNTFGDLYASALYTYTRNTQTGATAQVGQISGLYSFNPFWRLGANYQYIKGNAQLDHNRAQQVTTALQYSLSKRTMLYTDAAYQWTNGDVAGTHNAWIGGLMPSSNNHQFAAHIGMQTFF
ncbi:porin [Paraburkholderia bannensis]|uniref:porin n=1 Tax=Paraburkholderia bannensis TaxID=765414 RepID=UPI002AB5FC87|nr:porin [Paraburkholderia bannensis]